MEYEATVGLISIVRLLGAWENAKNRRESFLFGNGPRSMSNLGSRSMLEKHCNVELLVMCNADCTVSEQGLRKGCTTHIDDRRKSSLFGRLKDRTSRMQLVRCLDARRNYDR